MANDKKLKVIGGREEKDVAIARLKMGSANRLRMPPVLMRTLPDDAREAAIKELEK